MRRVWRGATAGRTPSTGAQSSASCSPTVWRRREKTAPPLHRQATVELHRIVSSSTQLGQLVTNCMAQQATDRPTAAQASHVLT